MDILTAAKASGGPTLAKDPSSGQLIDGSPQWSCHLVEPTSFQRRRMPSVCAIFDCFLAGKRLMIKCSKWWLADEEFQSAIIGASALATKSVNKHRSNPPFVLLRSRSCHNNSCKKITGGSVS